MSDDPRMFRTKAEALASIHQAQRRAEEENTREERDNTIGWRVVEGPIGYDWGRWVKPVYTPEYEAKQNVRVMQGVAASLLFGLGIVVFISGMMRYPDTSLMLPGAALIMLGMLLVMWLDR